MGVKLDRMQCITKLAEAIADNVELPEGCALDRDDIYQEVCLIYLERGYTQSPAPLKPRLRYMIANYIKPFSHEVSCGLLKDVTAYNAEQYEITDVINDTINEYLDNVLSTITPRERRVIQLHFGLRCNQLTLTEIGKLFNRSPWRMCQIERKGMKKLRHPSRTKRLREVYDIMDPNTYLE